MSIHTQSPHRRSRSKTNSSTRSPSTLSPKQKPSKQHKTNTHTSPSKSSSTPSTPTSSKQQKKALRLRPSALSPPLTTQDINLPQSPAPKPRRNSHKLKMQQLLQQQQQQQQKQQQQQTQPPTKPKRWKSVAFNNVVTVRPHHAQRPTNQMSVAFHGVVMVRPILHLEDYTDQEINDCWVGPEDKLQTKQEIVKTLKLLKASNSNENNIQNLRGLEKFSDGGKARERRRISIREVLEEQDRQKTNGSNDVAKLRKAYKPHSRAARHLAHAVGKIDEMEAACQKTVAAMPSNKVVWTR